MGDAQSAQREGKKDAVAEEGSGEVDDVQTEESPEDKPLKNKGQISEINGKADNSIAALNGHCEDEDEIAAEAILSPDEDVSGKEKPLKEEETPLENVEINEKTLADDADANEEMTEMEAKQNDINESFRKFFSNIGLKLTVKRGSVAPEEEANKAEDIKETAQERKSENDQANMDLNAAQEVYDNDSTACPTLTDVTPEDALENAEERTAETKEKVESDDADAGTALPVSEDAHQDATPEKDPHPTSQSSPDEQVGASPFKRFFTTGIFSGLRKKKKQEEDEATEKELVDMGKKETEDTTERPVQDQQEDKEEITPGVDASTIEKDLGENEPEILGSQEKDKVQASPLKRLLSGSSLKKHSKKQRSRKSSDAKLSDSGEHISDQLLSSTEEPAENQKEESPAKPSAEAAGEDDSAWASFKRLMTPKRRVKKPSLEHEDAQIPGSVEETKPSEAEQISDHSTEEGKKRKDSSVSWEAVLCGSGRRRSRRTSDSEEEAPQIDNGVNKQDSGPKESAESPLEGSSEVNEIQGDASKQAGSPPEDDAGSTWKSLKKLVTPKRKAKDEDESKENIQSDSDVTQDDSSFSIKKLLPGRKKRKSAEKQDQVSSDEADREVASDDEDSETPAVVPLSEFDTAETAVEIQTQADIESDLAKDADHELQQDLPDEKSEPIKPCKEDLIEAEKVQEDDGTFEASTAPVANEEPDDLTELLSKHQQLSDIPEEGVITDTMATPASFTEEAVRDDTIAEDFIEITSEAITAPEPVDVTLADETEMISAVSQLSDSSKTSGNTTPVPAEYSVQDTELVLQQVAENISASPEAVPVSSEELGAERIVCSVSRQINETFVKKETTILEIHRRSDATAINTGLRVEAIDAINELTATEQIESVSDINTSTEIISEEFDTAEISVDKVCEAEDLEIKDESQRAVESLSEVKESEEVMAEEQAGAEQAENEISKTQEAEPAAVADEAKDGALAQDIAEEVRVEDQSPPAAADELEALAAVETDTLASKEDSVQSLEKELPSSEDIPQEEKDTDQPKLIKEPLTEETVEPGVNVEEEVPCTEDSQASEKAVDEPKETTHLVEETTEPEEKEPQTELSGVIEELEDKQEAVLATEGGSVQSLEKEVISEDIPPAVTDEPKQTEEHLTEETVEPAISVEEEVPFTEDSLPAEKVADEPKETTHLVEETTEPEEKEPQADAPKIEHPDVSEVLEDETAAVLDSEEGSAQSIENEAISEDVPKAETTKDEPKEETVPITEDTVQPEDTSKTDHVQESEESHAAQAVTSVSEAGSSQLLEKEVISEDIPAAETVTDEPKQATEVSVEQEEEPKLEPEVSLHDAKDILSETAADAEVSTSAHAVAQSSDQETQIFAEDVTKAAPDSVATETENKVDQAAEINNYQTTESIQRRDVQVEQEDGVTETTEELQTLTGVHLSSVTEAASPRVQVVEAVAFSEETPAPCVDNAEASDEATHGVHVCEVQVSTEGEKAGELPGVEVKTAALEYSVATQITTCDLKDVSAHIPDVLIETTPEVQEPLIDRIANETQFKETIETATPLVKEVVTERAEEGSVVLTMHVSSLKSEDNHRIQVEVVDVDIKSAENVVDTVVEAGITEDKQVIDVCQETIEKMESLSATAEVKEEAINEEDKGTFQEVIQHVKENLPATVLQCVPVSLEQEVIKQAEASETVESESKVEEPEMERQDEAVTSDTSVIPTEHQISEDRTQSLDVSVQDRKEDSEEAEKSEVSVKAEEIATKKVDENTMEAQTLQTTQGQIVKPNNAGLAVPQNTGIISSIGNVESPSSLSLEFKLNIQFGQTRAPASSPPPPPTERFEPARQTDVSAGGVQAAEEVELIKPLNATQRAEGEKQTEVAVNAKETTEPTERLVITNQPVLQHVGTQAMKTVESVEPTEKPVIANLPVQRDVGIQAMEIIEPEEEIKATERVTLNVQAAAITEPVRRREKREMLLSQQLLSQNQTKAEEAVVQAEEENDQDVWLDAEEDICIQEEMEMEKPSESEEKAELELEFEMAPDSKSDDEERQQETHKAEEMYDVDSEGEDFAVALEQPETATATVEWD